MVSPFTVMLTDFTFAMSFHPFNSAPQNDAAQMTPHGFGRMRVGHHFNIAKAGDGPVKRGIVTAGKIFSQAGLEFRNAQRTVGNAEKYRARRRGCRRGNNHPGHRIITMATRQLMKPESVAVDGAGQMQRRDHFVLTAVGLIDAVKKIIRRERGVLFEYALAVQPTSARMGNGQIVLHNGRCTANFPSACFA